MAWPTAWFQNKFETQSDFCTNPVASGGLIRRNLFLVLAELDPYRTGEHQTIDFARFRT
jgi:hypothetical protein